MLNLPYAFSGKYGHVLFCVTAKSLATLQVRESTWRHHPGADCQQDFDGLVALLPKSISSRSFGNPIMRPEQSQMCRTLPIQPAAAPWYLQIGVDRSDVHFSPLCLLFGIIMRCASCSVYREYSDCCSCAK